MLLFAFGLLLQTGCIVTTDFGPNDPLPPGVAADVHAYTLTLGGPGDTHSERLTCLAQDAHDRKGCDANGDNCQPGCAYALTSRESGSTTAQALETIDESIWLDQGQARWVDVDLTPTQAQITEDREITLWLTYASSGFQTLEEQQIAHITVLAN